MVDATYFQDFRPQTPVLNGLVLMSYKNGVDHVAVIKDLDYKGGFLVTEGNYKKCKLTTRLIEWNDPSIKGFWSP